MREDKRGAINQNSPPILKRLNIEAENWLYLTQNLKSKLKGLVGSALKIKETCKVLCYKRDYCECSCKNYFP